MRIRLHLKPGQKGTKQLLAKYGDRLVCVRYRYDPERKKRYKTVELLVDERDWSPPPSRFRRDQTVGLRVAFTEVGVRSEIKQAGGTWNPDRKVWELRYDRAVALGSRTASWTIRHPVLDARNDGRGIYMWMPARHLRVDAGIHR